MLAHFFFHFSRLLPEMVGYRAFSIQSEDNPGSALSPCVHYLFFISLKFDAVKSRISLE